MKNLQTLWVGLSFLAVGLVAGLLISSGDLATVNLFGAEEEVETEETTVVPTVDPEQLAFVSVATDDDAMIGDPDAPVTIVEFSDFQCPYCGKFVMETMPLLMENYIETGLVNLVFRDFPLPSHTDAALASEAAECVRAETDDEGYFEMHDLIFENSSVWSYVEDPAAGLNELAGELGVDISACLANGTYTDEVADDYAAGRTYGISGTPTFFINGKKLVGAYPYEVFETIIEAALVDSVIETE